MNNTNSTVYYYDGVFYEILQDIVFLWAIVFCIIIPCLYDDDDDIQCLSKPCHFWCRIIIYIFSYIYNYILNIKNFIYSIIIYFTPISIPQENIIHNISTDNIPQNITIV